MLLARKMRTQHSKERKFYTELTTATKKSLAVEDPEDSRQTYNQMA